MSLRLPNRNANHHTHRIDPGVSCNHVNESMLYSFQSLFLTVRVPLVYRIYHSSTSHFEHGHIGEVSIMALIHAKVLIYGSTSWIGAYRILIGEQTL